MGFECERIVFYGLFLNTTLWSVFIFGPGTGRLRKVGIGWYYSDAKFRQRHQSTSHRETIRCLADLSKCVAPFALPCC